MSAFEELYGGKCKTPIKWDNKIYRVFIGLDMLNEISEKGAKIKHKLKVA